MKKIIKLLIVTAMIIAGTSASAQNFNVGSIIVDSTIVVIPQTARTFVVHITGLVANTWVYLDYDTTTAYTHYVGPVPLTPVTDTVLYMAVTGLTANTLYHRQVRLQGGASGLSDPDTFSTAACNFTPFITASDTVICANDSATLILTMIGTSYQWKRNNINIVGATASTYVAHFAGVYTCLVSDSTCSATSNAINITVSSQTVVATISPNVSICQGQSTVLVAGGGTDYLWSPTASLSNPSTDTTTATPNVTTTYQVIVSNSFCGGWGSASVTVTVLPAPVATATNDTSICGSGLVALHASGAGVGGTYQWSPAVGLNNPNSQNPTAFVTGTITYTALVTNANQCTDTESVTITVNTVYPTVSVFPASLNICAGTTINLIASGTATSYLWTPGSFSGSTYPVTPGVGVHLYTVTANLGGCTATASTTITVFAAPTVTTNGNQSVCSGHGVGLSASGASTYSWSPSTGLSTTTGASVTAMPASTTTYTVIGTSSDGCTASTQVTVTVNPSMTLTSWFYDGSCGLQLNGNFPVLIQGVIVQSVFRPAVTSTSTQATINPVCLNSGNLVSIITGSGCDTSFIYLPTGVGEVAEGEVINVYPNPFRDVLNVELPSGKYQVSLVNLSGQQVRTVNVEKSFTIQRDNLATGFYFLRIISEKSTRTLKVQIVD
jgi:hypothetical protein